MQKSSSYSPVKGEDQQPATKSKNQKATNNTHRMKQPNKNTVVSLISNQAALFPSGKASCPLSTSSAGSQPVLPCCTRLGLCRAVTHETSFGRWMHWVVPVSNYDTPVLIVVETTRENPPSGTTVKRNCNENQQYFGIDLGQKEIVISICRLCLVIDFYFWGGLIQQD